MVCNNLGEEVEDGDSHTADATGKDCNSIGADDAGK